MMYRNDEAIAFGWFTIVLFFLVVILMWVLMLPAFNAISDYFNTDERIEGIVSQQCVDAMTWNQNIFFWGVPVFSLLGIMIYAMIRAIERKGYDY